MDHEKSDTLSTPLIAADSANGSAVVVAPAVPAADGSITIAVDRDRNDRKSLVYDQATDQAKAPFLVPTSPPSSAAAAGAVGADAPRRRMSSFGVLDTPRNGLPLGTTTLTREEVIDSARTLKELKPLNPSLFRWNVLWLAVLLLVLFLPVWLPYTHSAGCDATFLAIASVALWFDVIWFLAIVFSVWYLWRMKRGMDSDHKALYPRHTALYHIIILTIYRDPMEVVMRTVESLAKQTEARRLIMVIGWEGRTPQRAERTAQLRNAFGKSFKLLLFTVHELAPHEIASKAANANWALRSAVATVFTSPDFPQSLNVTNFTVSTCDSDTLYHARYFEAVGADYLNLLHARDPQVHTTIWQAPLFYNWALDQSAFITRITGLLRSTFMMGLLIPYNVNPMSCFTFSLELAIRGGYWHPQIFMDDVGYLMTMMIGAQSRIRIRALPVPVLSGPTSGDTWSNDVYEWYVQVRRWAIGTADNFHYAIVKSRSMPLFAGILFFVSYFLYYGVILCVGSLFGVMAFTYPAICGAHAADDLPLVTFVGGITGGMPSGTNALIALLVVQYILYGCMFLLDMWWIRAILHIREDISFLRNAAHYVLTGPAMLALNLVNLWGYIFLTLRGKPACVHQVAGKATLGAPIPSASTGADAAATSGSLNASAASSASAAAAASSSIPPPALVVSNTASLDSSGGVRP